MADFPVVYTFGHGKLDVSILTGAGIGVVIDIRRNPMPADAPGFNREHFQAQLDANNIVYHWAGRHLGGDLKSTSPSRHRALRSPALRAYADYMGAPEFRRAAQQLMNLASDANAVLLAAEPEPDVCHRSLIADLLLLEGWQVFHLDHSGGMNEHLLRPEARRESAELIYDNDTQ